ncbi:MAG: hypothetical protein M0025_04755 [Elusimicrobia bacterium]|nr:hypothetical protein [Elusimicrobiota bacterium]
MERIKGLAGRLGAGTLVFAAAAAAYLPLLSLPFVFDDGMSVRDNPFLRHFSSALRLFSPDYTRIFRNESFEPLTYAVLMPAGRLFAWQPWGLHLLSLSAHAACAWAVYRLALRLFGEKRPAAAAGLFFALHPAQSGTLIAVLFTGTVFSALFFLWALYRFIARDGRDGAAGKLLTGLLFGVSLLFKERSFTGLPLFFLLPLARAGGGLKELRRRLPELLWLTAFWAAALLSRLPAGRGSGLGTRFLDPAWVPARAAEYAKMLVLPFWLSPAAQKVSVIPGPAALAALALAAAGLFYALRRGRSGPDGYGPAALGAALAALTLLPYLNVLPLNDLAEYLGSVFVSSRYLYLPLAGGALAFGALYSGLEKSCPSRLLSAASASAAALFLALSVSQQLIWRSDEAVWTRAVRLNPRSAWANYMLGSYYLQEGLTGRAQSFLLPALGMDPDRGVRSNLLGALAACALMEGDAGLAADTAASALRVWDGNYDAWNTYGAALASLGRKEEAVRAFEAAGSAETTGPAPLVNLGKLLLELRRPAGAAAALERALLRERTPDTLDLLCSAYAGAGEPRKAELACLDALRLAPGRPGTLLRLARIYVSLGMKEPALLCLDEAGKLAPDSTAEIRELRRRADGLSSPTPGTPPSPARR